MKARCACGVEVSAGDFEALKVACVLHVMNKHPDRWKTIAEVTGDAGLFAAVMVFHSRDPQFTRERENMSARTHASMTALLSPRLPTP